MSEFQQFLAMGGYAFYVWTSYAVTFIVLALNVWLSGRGLSVLRRQTRQRALQAPARARRQTSNGAEPVAGPSARSHVS